MKTAFVTFESQSNRPRGSVGSTRIRCRWLYDMWEDAEDYQIGKKYDALIFQKVYWDKMMEEFKGIKIMDLCDPDWMQGRDVMKYCNMADAVVTSTQALADYIKKFVKGKPVICIADRVKMSEHEPYRKKEHSPTIRKAVWFGYLHNTVYIEAVLRHLAKRGISLTVIADKALCVPDDLDLELKNVGFSYPNVHEEIAKADVAIMPIAGEVDLRGSFKSNNKTLTCWALGVPVVQYPDDFDKLATKESREKYAEEHYQEILDNWTVEKSVQEYKDLIGGIKRKD